MGDMAFLLDEHVEAYPVTDLLRVYLQQTGPTRTFAPAEHPPPVATVDVDDLWDHLGDFA
jgi:hypothetical protein